MTDNLSKQFGLLVAYLLPGFVALLVSAPFFPAVKVWLQPVSQIDLAVGPTVYVVLTALTAGMIVSCFRWLIIDQIHHRTGIVHPKWDDARLESRLSAFTYLVDAHYRYYQFYANSLVAIFFGYAVNRLFNTLPRLGLGTDLAVAIVCIVLFAGSRDALVNYYSSTDQLIGRVAEKDDADITMTNGRNHEADGCTSISRKPASAGIEEKEEPMRNAPAQAGIKMPDQPQHHADDHRVPAAF